MNPATGVENCTTGFKKTKKPKMSIDGKKTPMNEGSQLSITKETMMIEPTNRKKMGFVVGLNGCNLKRLKDNYTEPS